MMASAELLEAWVSLGKADSVSDMANGVIRVVARLSGLVWGYPSNLDALSAEISLSEGGRPMRKFSGKASWMVPGWERWLGKVGYPVRGSDVLPGWVRKSGKVAEYDQVGRSLVGKRSGKRLGKAGLIWSGTCPGTTWISVRVKFRITCSGSDSGEASGNTLWYDLGKRLE
jgi:hypothetical protein